MMSIQELVGLAIYGAAAVAYLLLALLVLYSQPGSRRADWLVGALAMSAVWAGGQLLSIWTGGLAQSVLVGLDAAHVAAWIVLLAVMLMESSAVTVAARLGRSFIVGALVLTVTVIAASGPSSVVPVASTLSLAAQALVLVLLLLGIVALEQVFRNARSERRLVLKWLMAAVGLIFVTEIAAYSHMLLSGAIHPLWQLGRGTANAAAVPLVLLAAKRNPDLAQDLFISRQFAFYATSVMAVGLYLLALATAGSLIGNQEGAWAVWFQIMLYVSAGAVLLFLLFHSALPSRLRVFLAKHFYRDPYDYKAEWLRLSRALTAKDGSMSLADRSVKALADIIGSPMGELWLVSPRRGTYLGRGGWNAARPRSVIDAGDALPAFLAATGWVIDTAEYAAHPGKYAHAFSSDPSWLGTPSIFVPLTHDDELVGIVRLERPADMDHLGFKDHDLLKTAGQQVAIFLMQERAQRELSETRQLETFSKVTAFLMHDLKNLLAQQELVVSNAQRHRHRKEFIDDAMNTIEAGVQRMKRLLDRLQGTTAAERVTKVELRKLLEEVCMGCADRSPAPVMRYEGPEVRVSVDRDKLSMVVTHAVRNAQDATPSDGRVTVTAGVEDATVVIEVADTGAGMDEEFVRDRLFKPFDSTKGTQGMGIGAYQIRETLWAAGGDVEVASSPGRGTRLIMKLPVLAAAERPAARTAVSG